MHRFISVLMLFGMMLSATHVNAFAHETLCESAHEWPAFRYIRGDEKISYSLKTKGPDWETFTSKHFEGIGLSCPSCDHQIVGQMYFSGIHAVTSRPYWHIPLNGKERIEMGIELAPQLGAAIRKEYLVPLASRENIQLGSFSGYSVLYRPKEGWFQNIAPLNPSDTPTAYNDNQVKDLLIIFMWDDCTEFAASIFIPRTEKVDWSILDKFLHEISFDKEITPYVKPAPIPPPKPPCWRESIECFSEALGLKN
ncbi:MAG: hypothetical protein JKX91_08360 [Rhizobiaceae bacterium]|nr:hypothetical protein [Rhizobiaceae bacterium]